MKNVPVPLSFSKILVSIVTILHRMNFTVHVKTNGDLEVVHTDYVITLSPMPTKKKKEPITELEKFIHTSQWEKLPEINELDILGCYGLNRDLWDTYIITRHNGKLVTVINEPYIGFTIVDEQPHEIIHEFNHAIEMQADLEEDESYTSTTRKVLPYIATSIIDCSRLN